MLSPFLIGLLVLGSVGFLVVFRRQSRKIASLKKALGKIELEETRVFDFLHGLGEAFSEEIRRGDLHRLIVEGAMRVLEAHGGALYLTNREASALVPGFTSKNCPPLVEIPPHIFTQAAVSPEVTHVALQSYLRLHAVERGEGLIGSVWRDGEPLLVAGEDPRLAGLRDSNLKTESAMLSPLHYGGHDLGVLAIAKGPAGTNFGGPDFAVFKAIAEQSAFALYNAFVYSEAEEKKRLDSDLMVAKEIQHILLPSSAPQMVNFEITGVNIPARHVSGDYFDYVKVDDDRCGVVIADVSGKGVPASLIMAMCRSVLRGQATANPSAAAVLQKVNRQLFPDIKEDMFISMAYVIVDDRASSVVLCRAGHNAPLLYSAKLGTISQINPPGMALGIDSGDVFDRISADFSVTLEKDDCLILYTDGVTEALDSRGFEFGLKQMIQSIQSSASQGANAVIQRLKDDLQSFVGTYPQNDDITMIVIRKK